jgi:hypothetical protein
MKPPYFDYWKSYDDPRGPVTLDDASKLWRNTWVYWHAIDDSAARLQRATVDTYELTWLRDEVSKELVQGPAKRRALAPAEVDVWWACRRCGHVVKHVENSATEVLTAPRLRHHADCEEAAWRVCKETSRALGHEVEYCDGIDCRRWRCRNCRRELPDKMMVALASRPAVAPDWRLHTAECAYRRSTRYFPDKVYLRMRHREELGQERLFALEVPRA